MADDPITFFNRTTGRLEQEQIYGEAPLRFAYQNPAGRAMLELIVKRALFSRWYGWRMDKPASRARVQPFIAKYGLDPAEFADAPDSYASFNEFFCRKLKPGARPVAADPDAVVFPADGRHLGFQNVAEAPGVFVKGQRFDIPTLLGSAELGARYREGTLVLSRLCPVDYHRFHFPCAGTPGTPRLINGPLYSVNPIALRRRLAYLWENKRAITELTTPRRPDTSGNTFDARRWIERVRLSMSKLAGVVLAAALVVMSVHPLLMSNLGFFSTTRFEIWRRVERSACKISVLDKKGMP